MSYIYIGLVFIALLSLESKWALIGSKLNKFNKVVLFATMFVVNVAALLTYILIKSPLLYFVLVTLLLLDGFIFLCLKKHREEVKLALNKKTKKFPKHPSKKHSNTINPQTKNVNWVKNYLKPVISLVFVYVYLMFQNQAHLSTNPAQFKFNTLMQYLFQALSLIMFGWTMFKLFKKFAFKVKVYNLTYIIFTLYVLLFILDGFLAFFLNYNTNILLKTLSHISFLNVIVIIIGVISSILLYTLLIFDFVVWKKCLKGSTYE